MITMKGAAVSAKLKEQVEKGLETLTWVPKLTIIRVGENPDDISYEKGATKKLTSFGLEVESKVFPGDISDEAFKREFAAINADASVDGILMLRPLPKQINEQDIEKMIDPAKDLDGISPVNIAKVFSGDTSGFAPCTAEAVVCMLKMNDIALSGKRVAVVGRSMVVGRPLSMLLLHENATGDHLPLENCQPAGGMPGGGYSGCLRGKSSDDQPHLCKKGCRLSLTLGSM